MTALALVFTHQEPEPTHRPICSCTSGIQDDDESTLATNSDIYSDLDL